MQTITKQVKQLDHLVSILEGQQFQTRVDKNTGKFRDCHGRFLSYTEEDFGKFLWGIWNFRISELDPKVISVLVDLSGADYSPSSLYKICKRTDYETGKEMEASLQTA